MSDYESDRSSSSSSPGPTRPPFARVLGPLGKALQFGEQLKAKPFESTSTNSKPKSSVFGGPYVTATESAFTVHQPIPFAPAAASSEPQQQQPQPKQQPQQQQQPSMSAQKSDQSVESRPVRKFEYELTSNNANGIGIDASRFKKFAKEQVWSHQTSQGITVSFNVSEGGNNTGHRVEWSGTTTPGEFVNGEDQPIIKACFVVDACQDFWKILAGRNHSIKDGCVYDENNELFSEITPVYNMDIPPDYDLLKTYCFIRLHKTAASPAALASSKRRAEKIDQSIARAEAIDNYNWVDDDDDDDKPSRSVARHQTRSRNVVSFVPTNSVARTTSSPAPRPVSDSTSRAGKFLASLGRNPSKIDLERAAQLAGDDEKEEAARAGSTKGLTRLELVDTDALYSVENWGSILVGASFADRRDFLNSLVDAHMPRGAAETPESKKLFADLKDNIVAECTRADARQQCFADNDLARLNRAFLSWVGECKVISCKMEGKTFDSVKWMTELEKQGKSELELQMDKFVKAAPRQQQRRQQQRGAAAADDGNGGGKNRRGGGRGGNRTNNGGRPSSTGSSSSNGGRGANKLQWCNKCKTDPKLVAFKNHHHTDDHDQFMVMLRAAAGGGGGAQSSSSNSGGGSFQARRH
jgi:hypothetical protein